MSLELPGRIVVNFSNKIRSLARSSWEMCSSLLYFPYIDRCWVNHFRFFFNEKMSRVIDVILFEVSFQFYWGMIWEKFYNHNLIMLDKKYQLNSSYFFFKYDGFDEAEHLCLAGVCLSFDLLAEYWEAC